MRQQQEKIQEKLSDFQMANGQTISGREGVGAFIRDLFGNIITTRRNPMDPNVQSGQFFGPSNHSLSSNQIDNMNTSQFPSQQQRAIITNLSMITLPISNISFNQSNCVVLGNILLQMEEFGIDKLEKMNLQEILE